MIRAIAFDFDGVLAESVEVKTHAYALLFKGEEEEAVSQFIDYHNKHSGISRFEKIRVFYKDILQRPLSEERFQELCLRYSQLVVEGVVVAPWVKGAQDFIIQNENHYMFSIVSGTPEDELKEIVRRREMDHFFDAVRGSPKDKVTLLNEVTDKHGLKPEEMVFVGDAETDWLAAQQLGVNFLWRCASNQAPPFSGYKGPRMHSLKDLDLNLRQWIQTQC